MLECLVSNTKSTEFRYDTTTSAYTKKIVNPQICPSGWLGFGLGIPESTSMFLMIILSSSTNTFLKYPSSRPMYMMLKST